MRCGNNHPRGLGFHLLGEKEGGGANGNFFQNLVFPKVFHIVPFMFPPSAELLLLLLVGARALRTLWSPPVSLNQERHTMEER
jgi:hypothetical protein